MTELQKISYMRKGLQYGMLAMWVYFAYNVLTGLTPSESLVETTISVVGAVLSIGFQGILSIIVVMLSNELGRRALFSVANREGVLSEVMVAYSKGKL